MRKACAALKQCYNNRMLFGRKQDEGKTVLILDIESGSVGSALARLAPDGSLTLLGEFRKHMPIRQGRNVEALAEDTAKLAGEAIERMSELAARLRHQTTSPELGIVGDISIFMAPPWGKPNLSTGTPDFVPHMQSMLVREASPYFETSPRFFSSAGAATHSLRGLLPYEDKYLLCIVTHEMTELVLIYNGSVVGHATVPHGMNLPLRTLKSHGALSDAEARSALGLQHLHEPLSAATEAYTNEFKGAARELFDIYSPERVWVVSPAGDFFARTLSHDSLSALFPQGGIVRALMPHHAQQHLDAQGSRDLFLILEALYVRYTQ